MEDYDAILIAKDIHRTLVTAEVLISEVSCIPEINVSSIGIADFLTAESTTLEELFDFIGKMIKYKFTVPFTANTIYKIIDYLENSDLRDRRKIVNNWIEVLSISKEDFRYQSELASHIKRNMYHLVKNEDIENPIISSLKKAFINI